MGACHACPGSINTEPRQLRMKSILALLLILGLFGCKATGEQGGGPMPEGRSYVIRVLAAPG